MNKTEETGLPGNLPGFDDPLALLRACHTRILDYCDLLEQLASMLGNGKDETQLRDTARKVNTWFSGSARLHHQDEETDLFPLLARQSLKLADLIHALRQEHEQLDTLWTTLETDLKQITQLDDPEPFIASAARFCELNRQHVQRENMELLPVAASSLSHEQVKDIGVAMAGRRGVRFTG
ncbi:MAG: hemerythrin domain-containing protein [Thiohalobacterales bacterium]